MSNKQYHIETLALHAGQVPEPATQARAVPVYRTTAFSFRDAKHGADLFALRELGNIYARLMNPTNDVLEQRLAQLEGGAAALSLSSGTAAIYFAVTNILRAGDELVSASNLCGGTYTHRFPSGSADTVPASVASSSTPASSTGRIRNSRSSTSRTAATTACASPTTSAPRIPSPSSCACAPSDSETKAPPSRRTPPGSSSKASKRSRCARRNIPRTPSKWRSIFRSARRSTGSAIPDSKATPRTRSRTKYLPNGAGGMVVFGVKGGKEAGARIVDNVKLFSHLANVGDAKSLIIHPASTTHSQLSEADQIASGVRPELVRLSIGLEHIDDIINDLEETLKPV